jgi:hypothetical protein
MDRFPSRESSLEVQRYLDKYEAKKNKKSLAAKKSQSADNLKPLPSRHIDRSENAYGTTSSAFSDSDIRKSGDDDDNHHKFGKASTLGRPGKKSRPKPTLTIVTDKKAIASASVYATIPRNMASKQHPMHQQQHQQQQHHHQQHSQSQQGTIRTKSTVSKSLPRKSPGRSLTELMPNVFQKSKHQKHKDDSSSTSSMDDDDDDEDASYVNKEQHKQAKKVSSAMKFSTRNASLHRNQHQKQQLLPDAPPANENAKTEGMSFSPIVETAPASILNTYLADHSKHEITEKKSTTANATATLKNVMQKFTSSSPATRSTPDQPPSLSSSYSAPNLFSPQSQIKQYAPALIPPETTTSSASFSLSSLSLNRAPKTPKTPTKTAMWGTTPRTPSAPSIAGGASIGNQAGGNGLGMRKKSFGTLNVRFAEEAELISGMGSGMGGADAAASGSAIRQEDQGIMMKSKGVVGKESVAVGAEGEDSAQFHVTKVPLSVAAEQKDLKGSFLERDTRMRYQDFFSSNHNAPHDEINKNTTTHSTGSSLKTLPPRRASEGTAVVSTSRSDRSMPVPTTTPTSIATHTPVTPSMSTSAPNQDRSALERETMLRYQEFFNSSSSSSSTTTTNPSQPFGHGPKALPIPPVTSHHGNQYNTTGRIPENKKPALSALSVSLNRSGINTTTTTTTTNNNNNFIAVHDPTTTNPKILPVNAVPIAGKHSKKPVAVAEEYIDDESSFSDSDDDGDLNGSGDRTRTLGRKMKRVLKKAKKDFWKAGLSV